MIDTMKLDVSSAGTELKQENSELQQKNRVLLAWIEENHGVDARKAAREHMRGSMLKSEPSAA